MDSEPFITQTQKLGQQTKGVPRVLSKFVVNSSLGSGFNCSGLNSLRKAGHLRGEYSCQNQTVADENGGRKAISGAMAWLLPLGVAMLYSC